MSTGDVLAAPAIGRRAEAGRIIGAGCTLGLIFAWLLNPTPPYPDHLLLLTTFAFMAYGWALELLRRLAPFLALLLTYEMFRGLVPSLNDRVSFEWMIHADLRMAGGELPTATLQDLLWRGEPSWYDHLFGIAYMSHFVVPVLVVVLTWRFRPAMHRFVVSCFLTVSVAAFTTFLLFPAAPPWMAAQEGYIEPITRINPHVYRELDLASSATLWALPAPNPVAAVPSLHAAWATLLAVLVFMFFGWRWLLAALPYPVVIFVGTVYAGEHYLVDEVLGAAYALAAVAVVHWARVAIVVFRARLAVRRYTAAPVPSTQLVPVHQIGLPSVSSNHAGPLDQFVGRAAVTPEP